MRKLAPDARYPVNALRNAAWALATTSHVLILDVDFWPSAETFASARLAARGVVARPNAAAVVPAFKLVGRDAPQGPRSALTAADAKLLASLVPRTRAGLLRCLARRNATALRRTWRPKRENLWETASPNEKAGDKVPRLAYCAGFENHGSTRFDKWIGAADSLFPVKIPCFLASWFEPYLVVERCETPRFDERYDGYGKNKLEWVARRAGTAPRPGPDSNSRRKDVQRQ